MSILTVTTMRSVSLYIGLRPTWVRGALFSNLGLLTARSCIKRREMA